MPARPPSAAGPPADRHAVRVRLLAEVIAHDPGPFTDRVRRALALTCDLLGLEVGLLSRVEGDTCTVTAAYAPGTEIVEGTRFDLSAAFCSLTLAEGDLVEIPHAGASAHRCHPSHATFGIESYVGVPVVVDGEAWGTLSFSSPRPLPSRLGSADHDLVRVLAIWIGGVLEREAQGRRLDQAASRLLDVVGQAPVLVIGTDADGTVTLSEGAALDALGIEAGGFVGQSFVDVLANHPASLAAVRDVLGGTPRSWESRIRGRDLMTKARPVVGPDGAVDGTISVLFDVTDQTRVREALQRSQERARALSEATFEGIAFSTGGRILDCNHQFAVLFGYDRPDEVVGRQADEIVAPESRETVARMIRDDRTEEYQAVCVRRDGARFWAQIQGRTVDDPDRDVRVTAVRDVSRRREIDEQRRFQADVLAHVSDAVVALDLDGRVTYWNGGAERLHGLAADDVLGRALTDVAAYALPARAGDDVHALDDPEAALQSDAARDGELIYLAPDGDRRFVSVSSSVLHDEDGQPRGLLAVSRDVTDQRRLSARLRHQATHDALTGLPNRTLFRERIEAALHDGAPFAVLFIDLDRFKAVNDTLGHVAGDRLLTEVSSRLRDALRPLPGALVARLGGDEFGVLAPTDDAVALAEALLDALRVPIPFGAREVVPSASVGVVGGGERYDAAGALLRDADTAMYAAKHEGRGRLSVFTEAMRRAAALRFRLEDDLRYATGRGQVRPFFRPVVDLATGRVAGVEAVTRWAHPDLGLLTPDRFLPLAEELGLATEIDHWILNRACAEVAAWGREAVDALALVSVGCSRQTLLAPGLADHARAAADLAGLPPDRLVVRLTEQALADLDPDLTSDVVAGIREHGLGLAVTDFGARFSPLGLVHARSVDAVAIDRAFVADVEGSAPSRAVVRAVVGLSRDLGMRVVAEGVETPGQLRALRELGVPYAQGRLFADPAASDDARGVIDSPPWAGDWTAWTEAAVALL